jgi:hypothetical protein
MSIITEKEQLELTKFFSGECGFLHLNPAEFISENERIKFLEELKVMPFTFEYPGLPPCWGKAFENYLSMEEYFAPHETDVKVESLTSPLTNRVINWLESMGISVEPLFCNRFEKDYTLGDFRTIEIAAHQSILHIDDIKNDGTWKEDFEMPEVLKGQKYEQFSFFIQLENPEGNGVLRLYDKLYSDSDKDFLNENGWQFSDEVVKEVKSIDFVPKTGDVFMMRNQYFHDVLGDENAGSWLLYSLYVVYLPEMKKAFLYI